MHKRRLVVCMCGDYGNLGFQSTPTHRPKSTQPTDPRTSKKNFLRSRVRRARMRFRSRRRSICSCDFFRGFPDPPDDAFLLLLLFLPPPVLALPAGSCPSLPVSSSCWEVWWGDGRTEGLVKIRRRG